jgi:hypothetical protein
MITKKSKTYLIKENKKLQKINNFIHKNMLHDIPHEVLSDIACEAYEGKINAEQFLGACRFMDYYERYFKNMGESFQKYEFKEENGFFSRWGRMIDAPTFWQKERRKREREKFELELKEQFDN